MSTTIKHLLQTLADGVEGFSTAAKSVKDPELKILFEGFAAERHEMATELTAHSHADPQDEAVTVAGTLHRGWINLKSALTSGDDYAILTECELGEDHALKVFNEALDAPPSAESAATIGSISIRILAVHHEIKRRREAAREFHRS